MLLVGFFSDRATHRLRDTFSHAVVNVHDKVRSWRVPLVLLAAKDLRRVVDLGHVIVIVLAPDVLRKVVYIDIVVTKRHRSVVHEYRVEMVRDVAHVGELRFYERMEFPFSSLYICTPKCEETVVFRQMESL